MHVLTCLFVCVTYLDPGCPFDVTGHIQQFVHVYLQLWDGLLLKQQT